MEKLVRVFVVVAVCMLTLVNSSCDFSRPTNPGDPITKEIAEKNDLGEFYVGDVCWMRARIISCKYYDNLRDGLETIPVSKNMHRADGFGKIKIVAKTDRERFVVHLIETERNLNPDWLEFYLKPGRRIEFVIGVKNSGRSGYQKLDLYQGNEAILPVKYVRLDNRAK